MADRCDGAGVRSPQSRGAAPRRPGGAELPRRPRRKRRSYIGIFGVDLSLASYAPFTRNARALRRRSIAWQAAARLTAAEHREQLQQAGGAAGSRRADRKRRPRRPRAVRRRRGSAARRPAQHSRRWRRGCCEDFEVMERDQQGYATTNGLFAIISTIARLPGRKSMILFSEGIAIPRPSSGCSSASSTPPTAPTSASTPWTRRACARRAIRRDSRSGEHGRRGRHQHRVRQATAVGARCRQALEKQGRAPPGSTLPASARWRRAPAGMIFNNTNNLRQGFDRIESDLRNYYLLGYSPSQRRLQRPLPQHRGQGQAPGRHGRGAQGLLRRPRYRRRPINPGKRLRSARSSRSRCRTRFPCAPARSSFRTRSSRPRPGRRGAQDGAADVPAGRDGKSYTSDFTVLVRFVDRQNQVVRKVSQHYEVTGPIADRSRAKKGEVIFIASRSWRPACTRWRPSSTTRRRASRASVFSTVEVAGDRGRRCA